MKKVLVFTVVLFLVFSLSATTTFTEKLTRPITLQGAYGSVIEVSFDRIATQSSSFTVGMPFDIEGRLVQYDMTSQGREIAYWSIICNTTFKFTISAEKLTSVEPIDSDATKKEYTELDYIMTFTYSIGYVDSVTGNNATKSGTFTFNTETQRCTYTDPDDLSKDEESKSGVFEYNIIPADASKSHLIGSVNGSVYFMFTDKTSKRIQAEEPEVPVVSGNYEAEVTMTVITT